MSAVVTLKKGEGRMVKSGGMWIFDNEIESVMAVSYTHLTLPTIA